ncbi:allophanate hydrolase [Mesorhizobium sp. L-8-10]|uniref:5-oxoprolinase subunit PxpB n=1 Tax=unclassified Mesorhizobium TaxID=325217 RepID=UPI0019296C0E|nr:MULTISPECIES: 5-oxoprolinase subunit PxpB [unclassified Mesorhizobium]BCH22310.1 allophanate hydrolase [Mesorhizobium sp. L-8-3]BCH30124.1 allophanate hydrolase [Mesorhizobium sp. L-8-10]
MTPTILPCGDAALVLQIGDKIDAEANACVIALADELTARALPGVLEIVPTYRSLLVRYNPGQIRGGDLEQRLLQAFEHPANVSDQGRLWIVPCLYGGEVGQDLDELAATKGLSSEEVIALHSGAEYRIYMIGFAPGFAYLGGLPEILHTPRLLKPRQNIPAGAIGIGGQQGNINSVAGPSGWRFIGWTPVKSFDPERAEPFLFRAGDRIRFRPIGEEESRDLIARSAAGEMIVVPETTGGLAQ